uniref:Glycosyltransferase family 92 protein n=1 Tax=Heterorhabditis bacteriophora TaxID=37862 RepID=A0A1I7W8U4_HETBA
MISLQLTTGTTGMTIPVRVPYSDQHEVVACFSPLFLSERWQLLLLTAEVYTHYGAIMHFYIRSMISDLFRILARYRNARVQPWPAVKLGKKRASSHNFDPNLELEFRNQAAAMTDCLLLYKVPLYESYIFFTSELYFSTKFQESAQYIIFPDTDDVIIPRLGKTYTEEFNKVCLSM